MRVLGLIFCETMEVDAQTSQVALAGLFQGRSFGHFPTPGDHFTIYCALTGRKAEGTMELTVTIPDEEVDIYRRRWWYTLAGGIVNNLEIQVKIKEYPAPGRYLVVLRFENRIIANRFLDVFEVGN